MRAATWRLWSSWLGLLAVGLAAAWLRYEWIEPNAMTPLCGGAHPDLGCNIRHLLVLGFLHNVYGISALLATVLAWTSKRCSVAWLAAALGMFALEMYCFQSGGLALLLGSLRLLRLQNTASPQLPPGGEHWQCQREV
jgi:hypothetical protein